MPATNSAKAAPPRLNTPHRRLDIQGLRALAIVFVVAFHANLPVPGGFVGVDVFFVVSGFVISAMLVREKLSSGRISLAGFYVRRFRRLAPALAVMVTVVVVVSALPFSNLTSQGMVAATAYGAMFMFANYAAAVSTGGYFDAAAELNPLLHTWSLSFEEQFYLVLPMLLIAAWHLGAKLRRPRMAMAVAITVLGLASLAVALISSLGMVIPLLPDTLVGFYGPMGRAWEFAAGALLAILGSRIKAAPSRLATLLGLAGLALLVFSLVGISGNTAFPGRATLIPVLGTLLLLYAGMSPGNAVSRALSTKPFVAIGDLSYSWYLWHWPLIVFASFLWPVSPVIPLVAAAVSLVPAYLSYRFVESPLRRPARESRKKFISLVALALLIPTAFNAAFGFALSNGFWSRPVQQMQASQELHAGIAAGCMSYSPITSETQDNCEWNDSGEGPPIYLIGDSIADHYSEALIGASKTLDRPLFMTTAAGCPAYRVILQEPDLPAPTDVTGLEGCNPYIEGTLEWLDTQPAGLVIMGARDISWWSPTDIADPNALVGSQFAAQAIDRAVPESAQQAALVSGISNTVEHLERAGHQVVIAQAPPSYRVPGPPWLPMSCSITSIASGDCGTTASVKEMDLLQGRTRAAVVDAANRSGATVLDLRSYFCPDDVCVTTRGNLNLYLDDIHISVPASSDLIPTFTDFIAALD